MTEQKIIHGDCIEKLKELEDNSIDAIITDPPYGLEFMGKEWDKFKEGKNIAGGTTGKGTPFGRSKPLNSVYQYGLREKNQLQLFCMDWAKECLRVLKPGGFLLSFGGARTYHRMTCGIEDAGFEIRDCIMWLYGSGFPKSLNIGKQIDKIQGNEREEWVEKRNGGGLIKGQAYEGGFEQEAGKRLASKGNSEWEGWGTALKPACEPIVVARKPLSEKNVALNVLKWGTGGINIDVCRIGYSNKNDKDAVDKKNKSFEGANNKEYDGIQFINKERNLEMNQQGRFPANIILDEEAGKMLDEQSGISKSVARPQRNANNENQNTYSSKGFGQQTGQEHSDKGGASRFFMNIPKENIYKYCSLCYNTLHKDINKEKWKNTDANNVEGNLKTIQAIKENSVQKNVMEIPREKIDRVVKYVGNLCQECTIDFVQNLVAILENQKDLQYQEESQVILDFIGNYKKCILLQNLVNYVEMQDNIDTTQITQNLLKLFGCVQVAIKNYIQKIEKSEPRRFLYQAKASKGERNLGCDELEEKNNDVHNNPNRMFQAETGVEMDKSTRKPNRNNHPTVKPIKLMEYLIKLVSKEGAIVLDPFVGSGTTLLACQKLNRKGVGIEKEEDYIKIAQARLSSQTKKENDKENLPL